MRKIVFSAFLSLALVIAQPAVLSGFGPAPLTGAARACYACDQETPAGPSLSDWVFWAYLVGVQNIAVDLLRQYGGILGEMAPMVVAAQTGWKKRIDEAGEIVRTTEAEKRRIDALSRKIAATEPEPPEIEEFRKGLFSKFRNLSTPRLKKARQEQRKARKQYELDSAARKGLEVLAQTVRRASTTIRKEGQQARLKMRAQYTPSKTERDRANRKIAAFTKQAAADRKRIERIRKKLATIRSKLAKIKAEERRVWQSLRANQKVMRSARRELESGRYKNDLRYMEELKTELESAQTVDDRLWKRAARLREQRVQQEKALRAAQKEVERALRATFGKKSALPVRF